MVDVKLLWRRHRSFIVFIVLMLSFRSAVADWNDVPTGSMEPTIVAGDRIWVNKLAYDIRLPFTDVVVHSHGAPQRGDIIVFESQVAGKRLVKRVVGLPGDRIGLRHNRLTINGQVARYELGEMQGAYIEQQEDLLGVTHLIRTRIEHSRSNSFPVVEVPRDHYWVLGDNRDMSADSRVIGLVPREEIIGKSSHVVFSLDYDQYLKPRPERFLKPL